MPNYIQEHETRVGIDSILYNARRIFNNLFGLLPFPGCLPNDGKYLVDLGDLKYSHDVLLRLASVSPFEDRARLVTDYLISCNPHLEKALRRMDSDTRRLFYKRLSDDNQFDWCVNQYPELELAHRHMQPGVSGLHVSDSVSRDMSNNKYIGSPLGAIIMFLLAYPGGARQDDPDSILNMFKEAPRTGNSLLTPASTSASLGMGSAAANFAAQTFLYGTQESHEAYERQKAEEQAKRTARLLQQNVEKVISEHTETIVLPRAHGHGGVKCVNIEPENSPSIETSEALKKIKSGHTGCTSVCGTQSDIAVKECLKQSHTFEYSHKDNLQCEEAGPFKSEDALKSQYVGEARKGVYAHETEWRKDQRKDPLFNNECKEPLPGNFNPYPGSSIDKTIQREDFAGLNKKFASSGVDFNKGCRLEAFPNPNDLRIPLGRIQDLTCEDISGGDIFVQDSYSLNLKDLETLSGEELYSGLQELRDSLLNLQSSLPPETCTE